MKPITNDMLSSLIQKFQSGRQPSLPPTNMTNGMGILGTSITAPIGAMTLALMGRLNSPAESPAEMAKLINALSFCPATLVMVLAAFTLRVALQSQIIGWQVFGQSPA
jgi:hypothetical protein